MDAQPLLCRRHIARLDPVEDLLMLLEDRVDAGIGGTRHRQHRPDRRREVLPGQQEATVTRTFEEGAVERHIEGDKILQALLLGRFGHLIEEFLHRRQIIACERSGGKLDRESFQPGRGAAQFLSGQHG